MRRRIGLFALFASTLAAADLSGIWVGQIPARFGEVQDVAFRFVQNGSGFEGKMYGDNDSLPVAEGKVEGEQISFSTSTEMNGGVSRFVYTGTIKGEEMQLTRQRDVPADDPNSEQRRKPQSLTLKRLLVVR